MAEGKCPARWPVVRLFVIPLFVAAAMVLVMIGIGWMTVAPLTLDEAIEQLRKSSGGARTAEVLVGPGAKQRYMAAQTISHRLREGLDRGMPPGERARLSERLVDVLVNHTSANEGQVQHFVLLAIGRVWQKDARESPADTAAEAAAARQRVLDVLLKGQGNRGPLLDAPSPATRKAVVLALGFMAGWPEVPAQAAPAVIRRLESGEEDLDVQIAAASRLGVLARAHDAGAATALVRAMREAEGARAEVAWNAALSLAQMNRMEAEPTLLMLLDRGQLAGLRIHDREADAQNPPVRPLTEEEQQRFLINAMQAAARMTVSEAVQKKLREVAASDPSARVRAAGAEMLQQAAK